MDRAKIFEMITDERNRQDAKWGEQHHLNPIWYSILGEEFGEVGKATNDYLFEDKGETPIKEELIQVAAVCVAWLEDNRRFKEYKESIKQKEPTVDCPECGGSGERTAKEFHTNKPYQLTCYKCEGSGIQKENLSKELKEKLAEAKKEIEELKEHVSDLLMKPVIKCTCGDCGEDLTFDSPLDNHFDLCLEPCNECSKEKDKQIAIGDRALEIRCKVECDIRPDNNCKLRCMDEKSCYELHLQQAQSEIEGEK
jgi:hypothetical protein